MWESIELIPDYCLSLNFTFVSFRLICANACDFENRILVKPALESVCCLATALLLYKESK